MRRTYERPMRASGDGAFMAFMFFAIWTAVVVISYSI
jgi:hypothetical protein